jgi:hypothetical protein
MQYKQLAETCFAYGIRAIPCEGKLPLKNKGYRDLIKPNAIIMPDHGEPDGLAVLCGPISGGFMCIDFDMKNGDGEDFYGEYMTLVKDDSPRLYSKLTCSRTPSGGYHIYAFIDKTVGSQKLAKTEGKKDLIETRGDGGYCLIPPSKGYTWERGGLTTVSRITEEEWEYLISLARCFNEHVPEEMPVYEPKGAPISGDSPLNRYDNDADPCAILSELGYRQIRGSRSQVHFNRPNARNKNGIDATVYMDKKHIHFWSPVSNANLPDTERNYKPSQFLVFTKYNGDFSAAAKELATLYSMQPVVQNNATTAKPVRPPEATIEKVKALQPSWRMEPWTEQKNRTGVAITDDLLSEAYEYFSELDPEEVREYIINYYRENRDFHGFEQIKNPYERLERYINGHFVIRRNVVNFTTQILKKPSLDTTGFDENSIWNLCRKSGIKCNMAEVKAFVNDPRHFVIHDPFKEYFIDLQKTHKPTDLDAIAKLAGYIRTDYVEFWQVMFRKALIRCVAAAIGGYVNREAIVLCDPKERAGKTSFVRFLNPWGEKEYYCEEVIVNHKDQMFRICQNFIYLIDEIGSERYNHKTMDYLKLILSKSSVNERKVYAVDTSFMERKVSFWGTTNLPYLSAGENTRWISIPISSIDHNYNNYITGHSEVSIHDVWHEAYTAYMNGEAFELTPQERDQQEELNKDWIIGNEALGLVDSYVYVDDHSVWRTAEQIIDQLAIANQNLTRRISAKNLSEALRARDVPHQHKPNAFGHKVHQFKCSVSVAATTEQ